MLIVSHVPWKYQKLRSEVFITIIKIFQKPLSHFITENKLVKQQIKDRYFIFNSESCENWFR